MLPFHDENIDDVDTAAAVVNDEDDVDDDDEEEMIETEDKNKHENIIFDYF